MQLPFETIDRNIIFATIISFFLIPPPLIFGNTFMLNISGRSFVTRLKNVLMTDPGATITYVMKSYTNTFACSGLSANYCAQ